MAHSKTITFPEGAVRVAPMGEEDWMFEYPRIDWDVMETFREALDYWKSGEWDMAEDMYRDLIDEYPEFIDVHHHLSLLLDRTSRKAEAFHLWQALVEAGMGCLPAQFEMGRDLLPWGVLENRPFLRACHALGLAYLNRGRIEEALAIFNDVLALNPGDNQGVRALLVDCCFLLDHPQGVLALCERYPDDGMEQLVYGRVLALCQLGRVEEARLALMDAISFLPLIAKELLKRRHPKPPGLDPKYVTFGGADQVYYYWNEQGVHWQNTAGALDLVRECLGE